MTLDDLELYSKIHDGIMEAWGPVAGSPVTSAAVHATIVACVNNPEWAKTWAAALNTDDAEKSGKQLVDALPVSLI